MDHLEELVGEPLEREALNERRYAHEISLIEAEELRPGIADYIEAAERHGIEAGDRLELRRAGGSTCTSSGSSAHTAGTRSSLPTATASARSRARRCTSRRSTCSVSTAAEAIVFEDSPNGVKAARAAGIFVVAIPNDVTREFGLDEADLVVDSLADLPPDELLARFS